MSNKKPLEIKMILLGESGVGKTSIIKRYLSDTFEKGESSTLSMSYVGKALEINGQKIILNIWDTIGQEKYRSISKLFLNEAKIVMLVYSINSQQTFRELEYWYNLYKEVLGEDAILGIAGNKIDLYLEQEISDEIAKDYAQKCGAIFSTLSAKENKDSIDNFIISLVEAYLKKIMKKDENRIIDKNNNSIKLNEVSQEKNIGNTPGGEGCCQGKKNKNRKKEDKGIINSIILGDNGVGKTSLIKRFEGKNFNNDEVHTSKTNESLIKNGNKKLKIYDINNDNKKSKKIIDIINTCKIYFLVYDINDKETLNNVGIWIEDIKRYKKENNNPDNYLLIIIANKKDNKEGIAGNEYAKEGETMAKDNKGIFRITSAKDNTGLNNLIGEAIQKYSNIK